MKTNIFEELQRSKLQLKEKVRKAAEYGWIPLTKAEGKDGGNDVISMEEIMEKIDNDTLTIGVIGQMKCGKSTFLNAFVFEDDVLPAATTPMTAALSLITYGERKHLVAEFYTPDEWAEQKMQSERSIDEAADNLDEARIKAAKELVKKAAVLGDTINSLLGQSREDALENLKDYVGADGRYVSITKSVTIYYPKEYLKGVEIVDTPGFNDPIVSREERTKDFLKRADVVLMMLYAGRPFDSTDHDILFQNVRQCGIGKVLVGINKYDIPFCNESNPEDEQQIKDYVRAEIRKACAECNDNTLIDILSEVEPIPLSAEMALLSMLPMTRISASSSYDFAWKRHCSNFGISTQADMRRWSHLDRLTTAVQEMVQKEKDAILFAKPLNALRAAGDRQQALVESKKNFTASRLALLNASDDDIEERADNLAKANKRLQKKIDRLEEDLNADIENLVRKGKIELEDVVDSSCRRMKDIIHNEWNIISSKKNIKPALDAEMQQLVTRKLKRTSQNLADEGKRKIRRDVADFFADAEELLMRYLPEFDSRDFVRSTQNRIQMDIENHDLFSYKMDKAKRNGAVSEFFSFFFQHFAGGLLSITGNILTHNEQVSMLESDINKIANDFDPMPFLDSAFHSKDDVIRFVKQAFLTDLIEPLQQQTDEVRTKLANRDSERQAAEAELTILQQQAKRIAEQTAELFPKA